MTPLFIILSTQVLAAGTVTSSVADVSTVTLASLIESAKVHNIDRRLSVQQQQKSDEEVRLAWAALIPSLSIQASWVHNQYDVVIPAGRFGPNEVTIQPQEQIDLVGRIDVPLVDVQRWMRTKSAQASRESAMARELMTTDQITRAVCSTWFNYAGALSVLRSAESSVAVSEAQLGLQEIRSKVGTATELELLRSRAEVMRNRQAVAESHRMIALSRRALTTLTGVDPGPAASLPKDDLSPGPSLAELEARVDQLPSVRGAVQDLKVVETIQLAAKLALIPVLSGQFTERVSNAGGFSGEAATFNTGLNLQWRLDAPTFVNRDLQDANVQAGVLAIERARLAARDQIHTDYQALQTALIKVETVRAQLEAVRRARDIASTRYEVGASTQLDVIQAERDLFAVEVQQIQARSDLAAARVALQISSGLPVDLPD